jgi:hypothetical protein
MPETSKAAKSMRKLRERRRKAGFREILVWVPLDKIEEVRTVTAFYCKAAAHEAAKSDPAQLDLFDFPDDET